MELTTDVVKGGSANPLKEGNADIGSFDSLNCPIPAQRAGGRTLACPTNEAPGNDEPRRLTNASNDFGWRQVRFLKHAVLIGYPKSTFNLFVNGWVVNRRSHGGYKYPQNLINSSAMDSAEGPRTAYTMSSTKPRLCTLGAAVRAGVPRGRCYRTYRELGTAPLLAILTMLLSDDLLTQNLSVHLPFKFAKRARRALPEYFEVSTSVPIF
jgi:hypothetical protein